MSIFELFSINNTLVTIPLGGGYAMSWIEAIDTLVGLACIWFASQERLALGDMFEVTSGLADLICQSIRQ